MERLAGVLLDVDPDQRERAGGLAQPHRKPAALAQRPIVLRDLVVLGHVGIEIVLARKHARLADRAAEHEPELEGGVDRRAVHDRERPRQPQAHRAHVRVRGRAKLGRTLAEHLAAGGELDVALETDPRFMGHGNSVSCSRPRRATSPRTSSARPARSRVGSLSSGPTNCTARGRPEPASPSGTASPGIPARLAPIVKMSLKYIARGSVVFSPSRNASVGATGSNMKSQRPNAAWYPRRIRV